MHRQYSINMDVLLDGNENIRYSRHLNLPQVGLEGQIKLKRASIIVVGAGGLGSPVLLYLAAVGVGKIGIIDNDVVELSNLQRQIIHSNSKIGESKAESAALRISDLNPRIEVVPMNVRLDTENVLDILGGYDVVIDGTDNFETRYIIGDACEKLEIPWIFGSIHRFDGQVSTFNYKKGPNYRDLFPSPPPLELAPNCEEAGVLGVLPGMIGTIQATESIKIILGIGEILTGKLLTLDGLTREMRILKFSANSNRPDVNQSKNRDVLEMLEISPVEFEDKKNKGWEVFLLDVRRGEEEEITSIDGTDLRIEHLAIPDRVSELPPDLDIVVYCRSGFRSAAVTRFLSELGVFSGKIYNLRGGIHEWSDTVDDNVIKY